MSLPPSLPQWLGAIAGRFAIQWKELIALEWWKRPNCRNLRFWAREQVEIVAPGRSEREKFSGLNIGKGLLHSQAMASRNPWYG